MKKILSAALLGLLLVGCLCGCQLQFDKEEIYYDTNATLDAAQYCALVDKQIALVSNKLITSCMDCKKVEQGDASPGDALKNAEFAMKQIQQAKDIVDRTNPPERYQDMRKNVLRQMTAAENDIKTYMDVLKEPEPDKNKLHNLAALMQADEVALTAEFNIYF